jgi:para-nitrobenzyl esterase
VVLELRILNIILKGVIAKMRKTTITVLVPILVLSLFAACGTKGKAVLSATSSETAIVRTKDGAVQGNADNGIYTYRGIPYAQAKERFVPAEALVPWDGVLDATAYGPISSQGTGFGIANYSDGSGNAVMDNNCQNLNVWTPGLDDRQRPVMVWLHGGGFSSGASSTDAATDGEKLSRFGDIVVVSVNHRLNILGHLDLSEYGGKYRHSANVGIADIVDALRWVNDNIRQFGGDPDNITVFGESGGGAKVLALMTTPYAKGLFHKAIVQSGTTETVGLKFNTKESAQRVTNLTLENLGISKDSIEELQTIDYETLTEQSNLALGQAAGEFGIPGPFGGFAMEWQPVVDGDYMPTHSVTEDSFADAGKDIPLLIGTNLNEWEAFALMMNIGGGQNDNKTTWNEETVNTKLEEKYGDRAEQIAVAFMEAYPYKTKADALYVDAMIRLPSLKIMSHKTDQQGAPVYAYMFSWESPVAPGLILANHTAEIPFVFHNIEKSPMMIGNSSEAYALEKRMSQAWINFARTGNPNTDELPEWPAFNRERGATMIFDNTPATVYNHDRHLLSLLRPGYVW